MQSDAPSSPEPGPQFTGFTTFFLFFCMSSHTHGHLQSQVLSFFLYQQSDEPSPPRLQSQISQISQKSPRPFICRAKGGSRGSLSLDAQHTSAYRQHTSAYVSIRQLYTAYVSIRISPIYSIRQHTPIAHI